MRESQKIFEMNTDFAICSLMREPELQEFVGLKTPTGKLSYAVSETVRIAIERFVRVSGFTHGVLIERLCRFYFSHYCSRFVPRSIASMGSPNFCPAFAMVSLPRRTARCECSIRASLHYSLSVDRWLTCWVCSNSEFTFSH